MASFVTLARPTDQSLLAPELAAKEGELRSMMRSMGNVLVAYSGGVDSAYLAYIASAELGDDALCVMGISPSVSSRQIDEARSFAAEHGLRFKEIDTEELVDPNYAANPTDRCFYCKDELYKKLRAIADEASIDFVVDGTNADDLKDIRPGRTAAKLRSVRSPLAESGLSKSDIRSLSRFHSLKSWDKPSSPCLSSRIAYGVPVTRRRLSQIEKAEEVVRSLGFREFRVRVHGDLARIEIAKDEMPGIMRSEVFELVSSELRSLGFKHITLDLEGYRSGSLN